MSEGYSYDLRRLQLMQLKILKEFVRVCQKHGFRFYIMNGTCLGAIRHGGFIPWDDDIDVGMYAEDYDRFIRCGADFGEEFFLQTIETDPGFKTMIARIRLNGTTILEKDFIDADIHHGVFIDVYPLFGYPEEPVRAQMRSWESLLYRMLLMEEAPRNHGKAAKIVGTVACSVIP
ncbi:MAG: LicD family protein, partial [Oscillospiraceae bacterium]|nr:LicD family protein [Oscillospiraceae bacterium]